MATNTHLRVKMCGTVSGNGTRLHELGTAYSLEFEGGQAVARFPDGEKIRVVGFLDLDARRVLVEFAKAVPGLDLELYSAAAKIRERAVRQAAVQGKGLQTV